MDGYAQISKDVINDYLQTNTTTYSNDKISNNLPGSSGTFAVGLLKGVLLGYTAGTILTTTSSSLLGTKVNQLVRDYDGSNTAIGIITEKKDSTTAVIRVLANNTDNLKTDADWKNVLNIFRPVGSVMIFKDPSKACNPSTLYPYSIWVKIYEDTCIIASGSFTDSDGTTKTFSKGNYAGSNTVYISGLNFPPHNHSVSADSQTMTNGGSSHTHTITGNYYFSMFRISDAGTQYDELVGWNVSAENKTGDWKSTTDSGGSHYHDMWVGSLIDGLHSMSSTGSLTSGTTTTPLYINPKTTGSVIWVRTA